MKYSHQIEKSKKWECIHGKDHVLRPVQPVLIGLQEDYLLLKRMKDQDFLEKQCLFKALSEILLQHQLFPYTEVENGY